MRETGALPPPLVVDPPAVLDRRHGAHDAFDQHRVRAAALIGLHPQPRRRR